VVILANAARPRRVRALESEPVVPFRLSSGPITTVPSDTRYCHWRSGILQDSSG